MGKRGPAPAPTALKLVRGDRRSRVASNEPKATNDRMPACPAWLPPEAKKVWRRLASDLHGQAILTDWDREAFVAYCVAAAIHREATEVVARDGVLVVGEKGEQVKNPALQVVRDSAQTLRSFAQDFGLTPSARSDLDVGAKPEENEARRLLS